MHPFASCSIALCLAALTTNVHAGNCKSIHAEMVEVRVTTGCDAGEAACFLGEVDGNHGLRGTTHFSADSVGVALPTSPGSLPYSGAFQYRLPTGTISMRETGMNTPGMVAAHQRVTEGTGEYAGATGDFFVHGTRVPGIVTTSVHGTLCLP
ncbi:hypothetical protein LK996_04695 [Lysobacter sp. A6]|uniref:Uncharacterized protein n=1 Tax=Noviluteimonas lactosilytica TaxID=2888523 RepID=A0ABS8JFI6_9GAMM|nr:hypothetical protein [Lysobacter lactosilyticus]MCC8362369.1 hypothetical protein [Lysobacter lactosilyticus]